MENIYNDGIIQFKCYEKACLSELCSDDNRNNIYYLLKYYKIHFITKIIIIEKFCIIFTNYQT